ncbi:oxygenase MpaB family protein [Mucilaginibacter gynuensis]|uniref:Oxygenase MpaB family protein n=1 Tax=Mucilaginibacter gynuensis TaxID=1302236 RepID=A0ABP8GMJ2_9SPHI
MYPRSPYNHQLLDLKRLSGDPQADEFIRRVFADLEKKKKLMHWMNGEPGPEKVHLLRELFPDDAFISKAADLPSWAQPRLMRSGAAFFARHSEIIMSLLGLLSLPYCYTAANGAMVLHISELIRKQTTKRLYDTAVFVWEVMGPDAFVADGNAYGEILKVRIMHAAVRHYTLQSGKWDNGWGLPVNQEDMAGTNLSFSLIVIRGLRMMGYSVSEEDQAAFMHIWAVVGYLTGLDEDLIPQNARAAQQLDLLIKERQFCTSAHGKELTRSLTAHLLSINESKATANDIIGLMRYLLGTEIADMLDIRARDLPGYKRTLIRTINSLKGLKPRGDSRSAYRKAYAAFKLRNPEFNKRS